MPGKHRAHYAWPYARDAKACVDAANANPNQTCWRCGQGPRGTADPWVAGHVHDGQVGGQLCPEHRSCNSKAGVQHRERIRATIAKPEPIIMAAQPPDDW